jgi:hypothetical protein
MFVQYLENLMNRTLLRQNYRPEPQRLPAWLQRIWHWL